MSFYSVSGQDVILNVRAKPRSSKPGLDGLEGDALRVRIRSAPVDGKANKELVETLAGEFGLPKSRVVFKSGETSKSKRILLVAPPQDVIKRLDGIERERSGM